MLVRINAEVETHASALIVQHLSAYADCFIGTAKQTNTFFKEGKFNKAVPILLGTTFIYYQYSYSAKLINSRRKVCLSPSPRLEIHDIFISLLQSLQLNLN